MDARLIASSGACMLALGAVGLLGPPGSSLALLALPLPALVAGGTGGAWQATMATLLAVGMIAGALGGSAGLGFLAVVGAPAVLSVVLLRRAWRLEPVLAAAAGTSLLGGMALAGWYEPNPAVWREGLATQWQASFEGSLDVYRDLGMSAEAIADLESARTAMTARLGMVLPALVLLVVSSVWLANLLLSRRWAGWLQLATLSRWRTADWMIWVLIVSGFGMFSPSQLVTWAAVNLFIVALACYFAQGLAIVSFFLQRVGLPRALRVATFTIITFQYIATALVVALGVFDFWGDFRNLSARPADAVAGRDSDG